VSLGAAAWVLAGVLAAEPPAEPPAPELVPHVAEDGRKSDRVHLQLDAAALWGIGGQMFLGTQLRFAAVLEHWSTAKAIGTWDLGAAFAYHNEPVFLAPWLDAAEVSGAAHRTVLVAHLGHSVHMGKRRRFALGLHGYGGWNYWRSAYTVDYAGEDVSGRAVVDRHLPVVGGELRLGYRVHRRVGLTMVLGAPVPSASSYGITWAHAGLGLSFHLR
jgi:hypothetical protein